MGLFHKTLQDAVNFAERNPEEAIKILRDHQKKAESLHHSLGQIKILFELRDYYEVIGELCRAIEKRDKRNIQGWINYMKRRLRVIRRALETMQELIELE